MLQRKHAKAVEFAAERCANAVSRADGFEGGCWVSNDRLNILRKQGVWMSRRSLLAKRCCAYIMDTSSHTDAYMQNGAGVADGRARRRPGWEFTELLTAVKRRLTDRKDAACIDAAQRYPLSAELHVFVYPWSC